MSTVTSSIDHPSGDTPPAYRSRSPLGVLPEFRKDALGLFTRAARQGGDVVRLRFGPNVNYLVSHPDYVQHILQLNNRNYRRQPVGNNLLRMISGLNLFTSDGDYWLGQRRIMQPSFHRSRIAGFCGIITAVTLRVLERWRAAIKDGVLLDIHTEMMRLTLEVVGLALFSVDLADETSLLGKSFRISTEYFNYRLTRILYAPLMLPTRRNRVLKQALADVQRLLQEMIDARRSTGVRKDDLMSMLLEARYEDSGEGMSDQQIRNELGVMIGAGHETTSNALTWTFYLLSQHPEVEARLLAELQTVLGDRVPTVEDLPGLEYTRQVLEESMRLYPPAWSLAGREAIQADQIGRYLLPARAPILIIPYVLHRDPRFWDHPERFDPDRFAPERSREQHRFAYIPFGGGPRKCIGATFALTEAQLILATLLPRVRLQLLPGYRVEPEPIFALRVKGGLPTRASWRSTRPDLVVTPVFSDG